MAKSKSQAKEAEPVKVEKKAEKKVDKKATASKKEVEVEVSVPVKKTKKASQKGGEKVPREKKSKRSFKAIYVNPAGQVVMEGRYCGAKPKQAGCKALTGIYKLFAKTKKPLKGEIFFGVRETTRGSKNKTYYYSGERVELDEPIKLQIGGGDGADAKTITYKYNSNVKKASEDECGHLANPIEIVDDEPEEAPKKAAPKKAEKAETKVEAKVEVKADAKPEKKQEKADKKKQNKK